MGEKEKNTESTASRTTNSSSMDSIITFAKENYDLITLFVGVIGVIIGFISLFYELKARKRKKKEKDKR